MEPRKDGLPVFLHWRAPTPSRDYPVRFGQRQPTSQAADGELARFDELDEGIEKRIVGGLIQRLVETNPNLKDEFLKFAQPQLLTLTAVEAAQAASR